jgi:hypothetical protein
VGACRDEWHAYLFGANELPAEFTPDLNLNLILILCSKTAPYLTTATVPERDSERMPALPDSPQLHSRT